MGDVIVAVASPPGTGAIAVIRISGDNSWDVVNKVLKRKPKNILPRRIYKNTIVDENGEVDEVLLVFYKGPKSYTGEDMVEIFCHGGYTITQMVLKTIIKAGARQAEPGEFTKRAFLNGKMDLSEAEAVRDLIEAKAEEEVRVFLKNLKGSMKRFVEDIKKELLGILAEIEVELDYPEDFETDTPKVMKKLENVLGKLSELLEKAEKTLSASHGIRVVIVGKPNVGKSTLLNRLLERDRAIVTPVPGTTRDVIYEDIIINGHHFKLVDTAGYRESADIVEKIGIERTVDEIENSDLVLFLVDPLQGWTEEDDRLYEMVKDKSLIIVQNKSDIADMNVPDKLRIHSVVKISALKGSGMEILKSMMVQKVKEYFEYLKGNVVVTSQRQKDLIESAYNHLKDAHSSLKNYIPIDLVSIDIQKAVKKLEEITGGNLQEEIIDTIFSNFCVGK